MSALPRLAFVIVLCAALVASTVVGALAVVAGWTAAPLDDDGDYVLLVLGSDAGPPRAGDALTGRADGFHLVVVTPDDHVTIVSLPRDSWVEIPGRATNRVNSSLTGGPELAVATAEALTGLDVDDWIATGFHGFIAAIDELGGVTIDVEQRLYDPVGATSDLQPGIQELDGWTALTYVRDRKSRPGGDLGRATSHARMLQALHAQVTAEAPDVRRIVELVGILRRHTASSIPPSRLFQLAALALSIDESSIDRLTVPATAGMAGEASVMRLGPASARIFEDLRDDGMLEADTLAQSAG